MIKVEVIKDFGLAKFNELKNIQRKSKEVKGQLFIGDTFECTEELAKYLTNEIPNPANDVFVKIIEVIPEVKEVKKEKKSRKTIAKK